MTNKNETNEDVVEWAEGFLEDLDTKREVEKLIEQEKQDSSKFPFVRESFEAFAKLALQRSKNKLREPLDEELREKCTELCGLQVMKAKEMGEDPYSPLFSLLYVGLNGLLSGENYFDSEDSIIFVAAVIDEYAGNREMDYLYDKDGKCPKGRNTLFYADVWCPEEALNKFQSSATPRFIKDRVLEIHGTNVTDSKKTVGKVTKKAKSKNN